MPWLMNFFKIKEPLRLSDQVAPWSHWGLLEGIVYAVCMCGWHRQATAHCDSKASLQRWFSPSTQWALEMDSDHEGADAFSCWASTHWSLTVSKRLIRSYLFLGENLTLTGLEETMTHTVHVPSQGCVSPASAAFPMNTGEGNATLFTTGIREIKWL